ncbi:DUF6263 family protein [Sinomicrobium sp. M5D2P17]
MATTSTMAFLVKDSTENGYNIDAKFKKIDIAMQMPQATIDFSSEKHDPDDIFSTILGAVTDKPFGITMSKTGKVTDVKNVETIWRTAMTPFKQLPETEKEQIMNAYKDDALKGTIEMVTAIYPDKPVNKKDKWTIETEFKSLMTAKVTTDYEFAELTPDYALIKGHSKIKTTDKDAYTESSNGILTKYDLTGSMRSEIKVNKNTGWIIEAKIHQEIKGDTYIKESPQTLNRMKIPMTMINEIVIKN